MRNALLGAASAIALLAAVPASAGDLNFTYVQNSLVQSTIISGPWTLHESKSSFAHDASGIVPALGPPQPSPPPPYVGTGVPYAGYCTASGQATKNHGPSLMQPYYFPFVRRRGPQIEGFFDYRPRNQQEAVVSAFSNDWGVTWHFTGQALALNPYCPWDPTDPDNLNLNLDGLKVDYSTSAGDNGLGHPVSLIINGVERLYELNRANGHIDSDPLVVHTLSSGHNSGSVAGLPDLGYVSPLASGGYPTLTAGALATSGLQSPDAIMGAVPMGSTTAVIYVEKQLGADGIYPACPNTPKFALTNLINTNKPKGRPPNHDVTTVRVATTIDGITFTDVGPATGLFDPSTTAFNGTRYLGSGSIVPLANGHYGMFFGAGNCLDNDSDGFHYIGYAETMKVVNTASDLLSWNSTHSTIRSCRPTR